MRIMDKILMLIEPDKKQANIFEDWLKEMGYSVTLAHNYESSLSKIKINPGIYYMCILDADFPGGITEGLDICKSLKTNKIAKVIPIVLMTYRGRLDNIISGLDAGADMFLLKPFDTSYFLKRIRLIIDDMESKKYMKGVIDFALIEFLLSLKEEGEIEKFLYVLIKGVNCTVWNKIISIMGFMPLQAAFERAKRLLKEKYRFINYISVFEDGFKVEGLPSDMKEISRNNIAEGFMHFFYHFLDIITILTGNIVVDMDMLKAWDRKMQKIEDENFQQA